MKYIYLIPVLFLVFSSCSQKTEEQIMNLSDKVDSLSAKVDKLAAKNNALEVELLLLENKLADSNKLKQGMDDAPVSASKSVSPAISKSISAPATTTKAKAAEKIVVDRQCIAITSSGKRCTRTALEGSKYCYQHKQIYEPDVPKK